MELVSLDCPSCEEHEKKERKKKKGTLGGTVDLVCVIYAAGAVTISCGSSSRYDRSWTGGRLLSEIRRALECWLAAYMVFRKYIRKDVLFHRSRVWMKESVIFSRCRMFAAVTRMEWVDHN